MKALKKQIGKFSFVLVILSLVQGCKVYHKDSITLHQAVESGKQTKIETNLDQTYRYKKIIFEDGKYYGVLKFKDQISQFAIDELNVSRIQIQNKTLSAVYTIILPIALVTGTVLVFDLIEKDKVDNILEDFQDN